MSSKSFSDQSVLYDSSKLSAFESTAQDIHYWHGGTLCPMLLLALFLVLIT